jgi:hypothetical protein
MVNFLKRFLKDNKAEADIIGVVIGGIGVVFVLIVGAYLLFNVTQILFP